MNKVQNNHGFGSQMYMYMYIIQILMYNFQFPSFEKLHIQRRYHQL